MRATAVVTFAGFAAYDSRVTATTAGGLTLCSVQCGGKPDGTHHRGVYAGHYGPHVGGRGGGRTTVGGQGDIPAHRSVAPEIVDGE